jgi:hypothetical protein
MASKLEGQFSLKEMIRLTYSSKYRTRFEYQKRDVLKKVLIIKETTLHPDRPDSPTVTFLFKTYSFPQYSPYTRHTDRRQKKYKHEYDSVLSIAADDDGKFSLNSTKWKYRLGSQKKWQDNVPQSKIKTLTKETSFKWKEEHLKAIEKLKKKYSGKDLTKKINQEKTLYKRKIENHKKKAPYLDEGDFNSRVNGLNGDFYYRVAPILQFWGHLYGRNVANISEGDSGHPFLPKHALQLIDFLIKINILH